MSETKRVVALGASNLSRGISTLTKLASAAWGPKTQVLAAPGYGRSYGSCSRVGFRTLPGILDSGLWRTLDSMPAASTKAIVTDVGNDILYGFSVETIMAWVEEAIDRLQRITPDITVTSLPLDSIRQLSRLKYFVVRSILFPGGTTPLARLIECVEEINAGLAMMAAGRDIRLLAPNPLWYGIDPIHIRRCFWILAWNEMLGTSVNSADSIRNLDLNRLKLSFLAPEHRWFFGFEQWTRQSGYLLSPGGRLWLF